MIACQHNIYGTPNLKVRGWGGVGGSSPYQMSILKNAQVACFGYTEWTCPMSIFRNTVVMCTPPDALCQLSEFGQWSIRGWEYSCCNTFSC